MEQTFEQLKEQTKGLTCLICQQGWDETMQDCISDNDYDDDEFGQRCLKEDVVFRLLDENLDYGCFNETEEELDNNELRSEMLEKRCCICEEISTIWVDGAIKCFDEAQSFLNAYLSYYDEWCESHEYIENCSEPACLSEWFANEYKK